ncbi:helix-turn-helix domain-containing protein [Streptomyces sp. CC208A]|uniref:helix-turn-helix domain-containing protein n=1 Tax=Streptomyces sp. CC208A TaxID=3044573 RepID=UPI0024A8AC17|nr:helix-turn-helix domain-containing protein [Streptomyces sp. CC208A]
MDNQHFSAPSARGGVIHDNVPLPDSESTRISNALLQDPRLSFVARGLGGFIQSLPAGTNISIRALVEAAAEGEVRVAAALRELEAAGYLERTRVRLPGGCLMTRTVSYNVPRTAENEPPEPDPDPDPDPGREPAPEEPEPALVRIPAPAPETPAPETPAPETPAQAAPTPPQAPAPTAAPTSALPDNRATRLLRGLCRVDPRLMLSARDIARLAPAVERWFAQRLDAEAITRALTTCLPEPMTHPSGLLAHRLANFQPPPPLTLPTAPGTATPQPVAEHPFQSCDGCERAIRAPGPALCRACAEARSEAQAA